MLVGARDHGVLVQRELHARGVPAVLAGGGHVFTTPAADEWLALLEALEQPHRSALVRSAALTSFFGHTTAELDAGGERLTGRIADTLRGWALLLRGRGVAALAEAAEERGLSARVLGVEDGERLLTDLRHLTQLLHETAVRDRLGLTALLAWFREEQRRTAATERPRRLDSDAAAVQIVTVHGSKGLQYPITYLPFAYQSFEFPTEVALYHDEGRRTLDVSGSGPGWDEHLARHRAEEGGEELRDLYVALTRAQSQVVAWWAPTANTRIGGLHRLLFGRQPGVTEVPDQVEVRDDEYAARVLDLLEELGGPVGEVAEVADAGPPARDGAPAALAARTFDRAVDADWRRTSYSGLIRIEETHAGRRERARGDRPRGRARRRRAGPPPPTRSPTSTRCRRRWPTSRRARRSAAWSTRCSSTPTPRRPTCARSCAPGSPSSCAGGRSTSPPTPSPRRCCRCTRRRSARSRRARRSAGSRCGTGCASSTSRSRSPAVTSARRTARSACATWRRCCARTCPPATRSRRTPTASSGRRSATSRCAATCPARSTRCCGSPTGGSSSSTTRPTCSATRTGRSPPRTTRRRCWPRRCCTRTTRCRRCCTPSSRTATCAGGCPATTRPRTSAACSTSTSAACAAPTTPLVDGHPTGVFSWQPPAALVGALSDLLDGAA